VGDRNRKPELVIHQGQQVCAMGKSVWGRKYGLVYQMNSEVKAIALNFGNDISKRNGSDKWELPVPGTFVIDTKGVVRFAHVDPNFMTGRADPTAVLDILTKLSPHREGK
jgi:peroxiredoxin